MKIEYYPIDQLIPYNKNPRKNLNVDKVAKSIKEFGFQQPIVVDTGMVIIVGHTRLEASKKLGLKEVPVLITDISPEKAKAYRIADNRLNQDSSWDYVLLNQEFGDLLDENYDITLSGFDEKELEKIITYDKDFDDSQFKDLDADQKKYQKSIVFNFDDLELFQDLTNKLHKYKQTYNLDTNEEALIDLLK